ncbi:MAG: hypothetical protein N2439_01010, partial [Anaerolineae bacterium]|nr:hypothetical protein [Anaerolineae bacterium]
VRMRLGEGARAEQALRKFFNYFPELRREVFEPVWLDTYRPDEEGAPWGRVHVAYRPPRDWNIRLNGRNLEYAGGLQAPIAPGDRLSIFPPGR